MSSWTRLDSRSLVRGHPGGEAAHQIRLVRRLHDGLGKQVHGADRGLQLVADIGDEVPADGIDPALLGDVFQQQG